MREREYFVISVAHTLRDSRYIVLFAEHNSGYRGRIDRNNNDFKYHVISGAPYPAKSKITSSVALYTTPPATEKLPGNSPVVPDGWIKCSERMPDEPEEGNK